ncbi:MAG: hypothetical protein ACO3OK_11595, partial [Limisphaerales bacterium]
MGDNAQRWVVVTDLDGSLLDHHTYSFEAALPALSVLKEEGIPLILNTSKRILFPPSKPNNLLQRPKKIPLRKSWTCFSKNPSSPQLSN